MPVNLLNEKDLNNYLVDVVYRGQEMEVFKSGDFKSTAFVEQNKDAIVRSMLFQWCKHRLRNHLAEDLPEHHDFLTPIKANEPNLPTWAERCLAEGKPIHRFETNKVPETLTENIGIIRDYLYASAESYVDKTLARVKDTNSKGKEQVSPKLRIDYLKTQDTYDTFAKTLEEAQKWHDIMAQKVKLRQRNEQMYQASLSGTCSVMKLTDGMEIVQLTTPEALDYESEYMGHCVGKGSYDEDVKKGTVKIYSLRDADSMPHATFEVRTNNKTPKDTIYQCKGKGNKAPVERYVPYIQEFVKAKDFDILGDSQNIGLIRLYDEETGKSELYDMYNIPKGKKFVYKGDLNLSDRNLTELSDLSSVRIDGNFSCFYNPLTSLRGAPREVGGNFYCNDTQITSLEGAPQKIGGDFKCSCSPLTSLKGAPQQVGGNFSCGRTQITSLEGAPQIVGGSFNCFYTPITSLHGAPKKVGSFDCCYTSITSLEGAPQEVDDSFYCHNTEITSLKGAPQKIRGNFHCNATKITSLEGAPQEVGGFSCSDTLITSLMGAPRIVNKSFYCYNTKITSLEGVPQIVGDNFDCNNTPITSLEGGPQKVNGDFRCSFTNITSLEYVPICTNIQCDWKISRKYGMSTQQFSYSEFMKKKLEMKHNEIFRKIKRNEAAKNVSPNKDEVKRKRTGKDKIAAKINIMFARMKQWVNK